ncbi:iron(3)-hydroxamate import ATP-binding protein FhuC [Candidatus Mycoplasma haematohominis]|uniref:Iron(3 )-hydroxamate import ATP-binding protein FhuC n=1 Tax=Candidatus Mycoplasma haematohominis TaxID=1494318 RepID=A0A478FSY6_9MOLU|nr:iron(3)-hydroxamate import ATP-binding protein FhuC [Candidatus Mycoplasma haemohominis]
MLFSRLRWLTVETVRSLLGEYTNWKSLQRQIKIVHITLLSALFATYCCWLSMAILATYIRTSTIFNQLSIIDIYNNSYKNLLVSNVPQDSLFLMAIYTILVKIFFLLLFFILAIYAFKVRTSYSLFLRRRLPSLDLETRALIPGLALRLLLIPLPYRTYKKIKTLSLPNRDPIISIDKVMNSFFDRQKFPEISDEKDMNQKPLLRVRDLSFMYHGDDAWDKWLHIFLKRFFPNLYQQHLLHRNTANKEEEASKEDPTVLKNISLSMKTGKFTTILGCNGSSKTTFLKAIINLFEKYSGSIEWLQKDLKDISLKSFYKNVAYVAQENIIHNEISVYDYVACGLFPSFSFFRFHYSKNDPTILNNLEKMEILQHRDKNMNNLSGGEKQKAILARVLTQQTPVIILDEPTTYLDINNQYKILNLLKKLQLEENKTIITILHDIKQAEQFSDEVVLLEDGAVFAYGPTKSVLNKANIEKVFGVSWHK